MAYTPLKVSIPEPCGEDWAQMTPVPDNTARHCANCAKNVVDFTGMTDAQLHAHFRANGGKVCGRFRADQLDRPLRAVRTPSRNPLKVAATAAGLMLAAAGCESPADDRGSVNAWQKIDLAEGSTDVPVTGGISLGPPPDIEAIGDDDFLEGEIEIYIESTPDEFTDETGTPNVVAEPVPPNSAELRIDFLPDTVDTDSPDYLYHHDWNAAKINPGRGVNAITGKYDTPPPPQSHNSGLLGMVNYSFEPSPPPTGIDLIIDTFTKALLPPPRPLENLPEHPRPRPDKEPPFLENLTVHPNPFVDRIVLETTLPNPDELTVELIDATGRLLLTEPWRTETGYNNLVLRPTAAGLTGGAYFLRVTDHTGRSITRTLVRQ